MKKLILMAIMLCSMTLIATAQLPEPLNQTELLTRTTQAFKDHYIIDNKCAYVYVYTTMLVVDGPVNNINVHYHNVYEKDGKIIIIGEELYNEVQKVVLLYKRKGYYCIQNNDVIWTTDRDSYNKMCNIIRQVIIPNYR